MTHGDVGSRPASGQRIAGSLARCPLEDGRVVRASRRLQRSLGAGACVPAKSIASDPTAECGLAGHTEGVPVRAVRPLASGALRLCGAGPTEGDCRKKQVSRLDPQCMRHGPVLSSCTSCTSCMYIRPVLAVLCILCVLANRRVQPGSPGRRVRRAGACIIVPRPLALCLACGPSLRPAPCAVRPASCALRWYHNGGSWLLKWEDPPSLIEDRGE